MELERGWPGRIEGDRVVQLAAQTLQAFFTGGASARSHAEYPLEACDFRPPVMHPPSVRVFAGLEPHEKPFFSFVSPYPIVAPEDEIAYPLGTDELVFRAAVAAVVGADGAIGGFTLANLWTARDLARAERAAGFGPSKSCDFGLSLGPVLVTPDESPADLLVACVNEQERESADLGALVFPWDDLVAHAAANTALRPGDLLLAAAPMSDGPPLVPGDIVELEREGIGVLRNRVATGRRRRHLEAVRAG
jgi:fumarylacetoacetate (FAA) hydrolase